MLVLALAATAVAIAFVGIGTASATVLCKTTTTPCSSPYGKGIVLVSTLASQTSNVLETNFEKENFVLQTCAQTQVKVEIENSGSATSTVAGPVRQLAGGLCAYPMSTIKLGSLEIHHIAGTDNGTVTGFFTEVTVSTTFFGSCIYGAGSGTDFGTLVGGESPTLKVNAIVKRVGGEPFCPNEARWTGEYKVTEPKPLYVEAS